MLVIAIGLVVALVAADLLDVSRSGTADKARNLPWLK
jgi:hypothetical protein